MQKIISLILINALLIISASTLFARQGDNPACTDPALFPTRMPDFRIEYCKTEDSGSYDFFATKGPKTRVEGKFTFIQYAFTGPRNKEPNSLAIVRYYENAIRQIGVTILQSMPTWWVNGKIVKDGQEVWAQSETANGKIFMRIVEKKEIRTRPPSATVPIALRPANPAVNSTLKPISGSNVLPCKVDRDCPNFNCVDGYCCDQKCEGHCRSCALPGHLGVCTAVPDGQDPRRACQISLGGHPACGGACYSGQCAFSDRGTYCGTCATCDGTGRCTVTPADDPGCGIISCRELNTSCRVYEDLTTNRCQMFRSCKVANDPMSCRTYRNLCN